ncbi:hypothetical protein GCM10028805_11750 [Spirosoma harenae]
MNPNVLLCQSEQELADHFFKDFIVHIDGKKVITLRQFYEEIADLLEISDFGFNIESLSDALNDLQWLDENRIVFYFTNTVELISKERDPAKLGALFSMLDATAEDWKWVSEEEEIDQKEIILVFEDSPRIRKLLDVDGIKYTPISELK